MATVSPGYTFTGTTDPITATKLNLLGQPTVSIGNNEVISAMLASGNTYAAPTLSDGTTLEQATPLYETYSTTAFSGTIAITFTATEGNTRRIAATSNTAATINAASVPRAGYVLRISFTTDGTAGNVITFGTNFKATNSGTLTLATASKYYSITFVSDGTSLIELGRTGAAG